MILILWDMVHSTMVLLLVCLGSSQTLLSSCDVNIAAEIPSTTSSTEISFSTSDFFERNGCGTGRGVLFRYTSSVDGLVTFETCGSLFDTVLGVFSLDPATRVCRLLGCNDDGCNRNSRLAVPMRANETVFVRVVDFFTTGIGQSGVIRVLFDPPNNFPACNATPINLGDVISLDGSSSPWVTFTPDESRTLRVRSSIIFGAPMFQLYGGLTCRDIRLIQSGTDLRVIATSQRAFWLRISSSASLSGSFVVDYTQSVGNSQCISAQSLQIPGSGAQVSASFLFNNFPFQPYLPSTCSSGIQGAWFSFSVPASRIWIVQTCGGAFDSVLQLFRGNSCGILTFIACSDDGCGRSSKISTFLSVNVTYFVRVSSCLSRSSNRGTLVVLPANDPVPVEAIVIPIVILIVSIICVLVAVYILKQRRSMIQRELVTANSASPTVEMQEVLGSPVFQEQSHANPPTTNSFYETSPVQYGQSPMEQVNVIVATESENVVGEKQQLVYQNVDQQRPTVENVEQIPLEVVQSENDIE